MGKLGSFSKYGWNWALGHGGVRHVLSFKELQSKIQADNEANNRMECAAKIGSPEEGPDPV